MTISSTTSKNQYTANGSTDTFTYTFKIFSENDIRCLLDDTVTVPSSVTGVGSDSGGTVVFSSNPTNGTIVTLKRNEPLLQDIEYVDGDDFPASAHEEGLDRSVIRDQYLQEQINRALLLPESSSVATLSIADPTGEAGKYLIVNDNEDGFDYVSVTGSLDGVAISSGDLQKPIRVNATEDGFEVSSTLKLSQINDDNGNELIKLTTTASAVNELTITNAATGGNPILSATGGDTNIGINIQPKGTGVVNVLGTSTTAAEIRLFEDTDNGVNYIGLKAPTSAGSSLTFTLPSADGSANQVMVTNGSGVLSFSTVSSILVQQVSSVVTATSTGATTTPFDDTIPQNTEGNEFITVTITPTNASNKLEIEFDGIFGEESNNDSPLTVAIFQDSTANALYAKAFIDGAGASAQDYYPVSGKFRMTAGTTSATTFKLRAGFATGTVRINGSGGSRKYGGVAASYLIVKEMTQ